MKNVSAKLAIAFAALVTAGAAYASEEVKYDCGDSSVGLNITVTQSPELGSTILNHNGRQFPLSYDHPGVYKGTNGYVEVQFFNADYPGDIMGDPPPAMFLGSEQFSCRRIVASNVNQQAASAGGTLNAPGLSLGGKLRAGPGTNYAQAGSTTEGTRLTIIRNSGVTFDGYDWFEVETSTGKRAFQWGGIMCSKGQKVPGIYSSCDSSANASSNTGWMAFAIGSNGRFGHGYAQSREEARRTALRFCADGSCQIDNETQAACHAMAQAGGGFWYGAGASRREAEGIAHRNCQSAMGGGSCPIGYAYCKP